MSEEKTDAELIAEVLKGNPESFDPLVRRYSPRLFGTARRYARRESEIEDIVQEIWGKAYKKLSSWRGDAPFEHWLMRTAVHTCYDFLRDHKRNREDNVTDISREDEDWMDRHAAAPGSTEEDTDAARQLVQQIGRAHV